MNIELLQPEQLRYWCELINFPNEAIIALENLRSKVCRDDNLTAAFHALHEHYVINGQWHREWTPLPVDPELVEKCGDDTSLFNLLVYLSALPHTWERYQVLGVSWEIFIATMYDIKRFTLEYHQAEGKWGFSIFPWIWRHLNSELFRIGRLQYILTPFNGGITAFRRKSNEKSGSYGGYILLADPNMPLRPDGYAWGAGREPDTPIPEENSDTWYPIFEVTTNGWRGHCITPYGCVIPNPVFLSDNDWEIVLKQGDLILEMHIPDNEEFNTRTCAESYFQAREFFRKVFPDQHYKALFCYTWQFTPQLQQFLPKTSNIVQFQREFYLYPVPGTVHFLWSFVFGGNYKDPARIKRDTTLRRNIIDYIDNQREIFDLAGVKFYQPDVWGSQPYMTDFDLFG
jgi:hypothetical protein